MSYTIKSLGFGQVAVLLNGKHVKKFGGPSAPTDARMFINKQHQASLPKERAPGLKDRQVAEELTGINNNIGNFTEDMLEQFSEDEINEMIEKYEGFEKLTGELKAKGAKSPEALAAWIGRKKYGKKKFQAKAAAGRNESVEQEEHIVHVDDGSKYGDQPHKKDADHVLAGVKKHNGEFKGNSDKGPYFKFTSKRDANNFVDHVKRAPHRTVYADLQEESVNEAAAYKPRPQPTKPPMSATTDEHIAWHRAMAKYHRKEHDRLEKIIRSGSGAVHPKAHNAEFREAERHQARADYLRKKVRQGWPEPHLESYDPEKESIDEALVKKMVKKDCLKTEGFADQFFEGEIIRESIEIEELQEADKNYDAYFKAMMKKAGITSIADLKTDDAKKEFMNSVDAGFSAKNEDVLYEEFMRADIEDKVQQHRKMGHKVDGIVHKISQGKPYAEFTVTQSDGSRKKYIFHGNVTRHERLAAE